MLKEKWYVQGINATPAFLHAGDASGISYMPERHGVGFHSFLFVAKNDYIDLHYSLADLQRLARYVIPKYLRNSKYFDKLLAMAAQDAAPMASYFKKHINLTPKKLDALSDHELVREYVRFIDIFYGSFSTSHFIEPIALTTDSDLKRRILADAGDLLDSRAFASVFSELTQPVVASYLHIYHQELESLLSAVLKKPVLKGVFKRNSLHDFKRALARYSAFSRRFERHLSEYYWIDTNWRSGVPYTLAHVLERMREVADVRKSPSNRTRPFSQIRARKQALIKKLGLSADTQKMITLIERTTAWQDDRKRIMLMGIWGADRLLGALAKRFGIRQADVRYLLPEETSVARLKSASLPKLLARRRSLSVYLFYKKERCVLDGRDAEQFCKKLDRADEHESSEIEGTAASLGTAVGRARVCIKLEDIRRVQPGDILVTTMTRPEFVPAMKKAAAVVTDEGGLTSHAAIVSRELGIPCVIGTKRATKVLKTGMLVEVRANHGMVRIISS